jgi:hypothetical protein
VLQALVQLALLELLVLQAQLVKLVLLEILALPVQMEIQALQVRKV